MKVEIFIPCFIDQLYPTVAMNMVKVLRKVGCTVHYNNKQTCCGQPAFNAGFWGEAKEVCSKFIKDFEGANYVVVPSASCTGFIKNYYQKLFTDGEKKEELDALQSRVFEFSDFLVNVLKITDVGATYKAKATYHDSCAALRECGIKQEPRILLQNVKGLEIKEMNAVETCCGFGGTFAVKFEPISIAMADQKAINARETGAEFIISTDISCLMHIDGYIKYKGMPLKTMHLADILSNF